MTEQKCVTILVSIGLIATAVKLVTVEVIEVLKFLAVQMHDLWAFLLGTWK